MQHIICSKFDKIFVRKSKRKFWLEISRCRKFCLRPNDLLMNWTNSSLLTFPSPFRSVILKDSIASCLSSASSGSNAAISSSQRIYPLPSFWNWKSQILGQVRNVWYKSIKPIKPLCSYNNTSRHVLQLVQK